MTILQTLDVDHDQINDKNDKHIAYPHLLDEDSSPEKD